jgi:HEAT repeat protein
LGRVKRDAFIADLKKMVEDKATAVRIESAIKLYQWKEHKFALPVLKKLRKQGVALRRAFQTGYEKGKPTYDKNAMAFFRDGIKNDNVYVRLDSAVGLVELDKAKKGLSVVKEVLENEEKYHIRMAAVNYMTPLKKNEKVRLLLQLATKDKDERVAKRARDVLGIGQPAPAAAPKPAAKPVPGK